MSERYSRVFSLPELLHEADAPVIIVAGALLRDNKDGSILAQLKIRNIGHKAIRAVTVVIITKDSADRPLNDVVSYDYLDLNIQRDQEFGSQNAVHLNESAARAFDVMVREIVFLDKTVWSSKKTIWKPLPKTTTLNDYLGDPQLVRQYKIRYGEQATVKPEKTDSIWQCTCGAWNLRSEATCHSCNLSLENLLSCDLIELAGERNARLEKERLERKELERRQREEQERKEAEEKAAREERERKAEERRIAAEQAAKKRKRTIAIVMPIVGVCIAFMVLLITVIIPKLKFNKALSLLNSGDYNAAYALLEEMGKNDVIDSNKYDRAMALIDSEDYTAAYALLNQIGNRDAIASSKYDRAMALIDSEDYEAAYALLKEIGKSDVISSSKHERAVTLMESGDYESAYALLEEIGENDMIASNKYDRAMESIESSDYETAYMLLDGLNYKDSANKVKSIKLQYEKSLLSKAQVGSYVYFGAYEQDNNTSNGKEDIEWLILEKKDDKALVISRYALDCQQYNASYTNITWEACSLRKWLNETFLWYAFSSEERNSIINSTITADKNPSFGTSPGNDTMDQVFLLSITELSKYFKSQTIQCQGTAYCYAQGAYKAGNGNCVWWLRTPGTDSKHVAFVNYDGSGSSGGSVNAETAAVRPAIWIDFGS